MLETVIDFAPAVYRFAKETGASVTSWGRSLLHNRKVGGVSNSYHLRWLAVDVVYDKRPSLATVTAVADKHGLQVIREKDHDHLQPKKG